MKTAFLFLMTFLIVASVSAEQPYQVGDKVPEFKLPYATAETINHDGIGSKEMLGQKYLIAFYPADWSGGCTKEVCTFRDGITEFEQLGVKILAISGDYVYSHHEWAKYHHLPFKLLADQTREFGKKMGVYQPQSGMMKRSVFLVNDLGVIVYADYDYSVADNADFELLKKALTE